MDTAIIIAAGEGTRMRPLTLTKPKPMLPVAGKPILEWDLKALSESKFSRAIIIVGYKKEKIMDYFGKSFSGMKLEYIEQKEQLGTGHAVSIVEEKLEKNEKFFLMNGDLLISNDLIKNFISESVELDCKNAIGLVEVKNPSEFGIVSLKNNRITNLVEKPKESKENLANAGVYIFNHEIFKGIEKIKKSTRAEYELTDAIKSLIPNVFGIECTGRWVDIGKPWDLLDANEIILKEIGEKLTKKESGAKIEDYSVIKGNVHIGRNSLIKSGAYIEGPVYIGDDCVIGPNCFIRAHSTIMNKCRIGNGVEIKNSIIMEGTNVGHLSYVGDSIIGESCNFGAGTKVANLKFNDDEVRVEIKDKIVKSGRRKFGVIMGDKVKTGINVSILPGRSIYPNSCIDAGMVVRNTIMQG